MTTTIGTPPEILALYRRLRGRALNDRHPDVLDFRYFGALVFAKIGRVGEALAEWNAQLPDALEVLGERHEKVGKIREQLAYWGSPE